MTKYTDDSGLMNLSPPSASSPNVSSPQVNSPNMNSPNTSAPSGNGMVDRLLENVGLKTSEGGTA